MGTAASSGAGEASTTVPARDADGQRKLIRPALQQPARAATAPARRREAPPDATGLEAATLGRMASSGSLVEVRLETGDVVTGRIEWIDRTCLKLRREAGSLVVMKHAIVTMHAVEGPGRRG